jgi:hypothetical protein
MLDFGQLMEFMKIEPGHGLLQSVLLFMIWWQSRGFRQDLKMLKEALGEAKIHMDKRFEKIEERLMFLEEHSMALKGEK